MSDTKSINNHIQWVCKCKCGTIKDIDGSHLRAGGTKRCRECSLKMIKGVKRPKNLMEIKNIAIELAEAYRTKNKDMLKELLKELSEAI